MPKSLQAVPFKVPFLDARGYVSQKWADFFHRLSERAGGVGDVLSNRELSQTLDLGDIESDIATLQTSVSSLTTSVNTLNILVDGLSQGRQL